MNKVCKFGGTSMANRAAILRAKEIVESEESRKFVIVSAPGKRFSEDEKVTDLLYKSYQEVVDFGKCGEAYGKVRSRFHDIVREMELSIDIDKYLDEIEEKINLSVSPDYAASRGEYLSALVMAVILKREFVDAAEIVKFNSAGFFDSETTNDLVKKRLENSKGAVIPGFYGSMPNGSIKTFSRGGSDISGAIITRGVGADVYENWTDVNGFLTADPRIVKEPLPIDELSYEELRELSYMGASVLHPESIFPLKNSHVPINIRNTFDPSNKGTYITRNNQSLRVVTGIAGRRDNITILIKKAMMNNEIGFGRKVLSVLENHGVSFEHMPSGIDTLSLVIDNNEIKNGLLDIIVNEIRGKVNPDTIDVVKDLALIAVVGHGMAYQAGTAAKVFQALANESINVRMIDQGSSELNIIVGVESHDFEKAINAIYHAFF